MQQRLSFLTLGVNDLVKATDFYETIFGWEKSKSSNENISFFLLNGLYLALYENKMLAEDATVSAEGNGFKSFTMAYNTRSKEEVNQLVEELRAKGVTIVKEPQEVIWGGYSSYIADLEENLWEIVYNPYLQMDKEGNVVE